MQGIKLIAFKGPEVIRKYRYDALFLLLFLMIVPFLVLKEVYVNIPLKPPSSNENIKTLYVQAIRADKDKKYEGILARNIFTPNGLYEADTTTPIQSTTQPEPKLPEKKYTLMATSTDSRKLAIITDESGQIQTIEEKNTTNDGSILEKVEDTSITLKKGPNERVLKIFNVKGGPQKK